MSYVLLLWSGLQFLQKELGVPGRQLRDSNQKPASASALKPPLQSAAPREAEGLTWVRRAGCRAAWSFVVALPSLGFHSPYSDWSSPSRGMPWYLVWGSPGV